MVKILVLGTKSAISESEEKATVEMKVGFSYNGQILKFWIIKEPRHVYLKIRSLAINNFFLNIPSRPK